MLLDNEIDEAIKKSCPTYEDNNNNIKDTVTDIIKSCLQQSQQPPTSPNPEPQILLLHQIQAQILLLHQIQAQIHLRWIRISFIFHRFRAEDE